jgi:hypothetical protein
MVWSNLRRYETSYVPNVIFFAPDPGRAETPACDEPRRDFRATIRPRAGKPMPQSAKADFVPS